MNARLVALSFVLALQVSCGVTQQRCSISTCSMGCCDSSGLCVAGNTQTACGSRGGTCSACSFGFQCISGTCIGTGSGTGGGTGGFSGGVAGGGTAGGSSAGGAASAGGTTAGGFVTAGGSVTAGGASGGGFVTAGGASGGGFVTAGGASAGGFVTAGGSVTAGGMSGGGFVTAGGASGGGFVTAGGTASAGGSAGGGSATCSNCPGCCLNGVCQAGNTTALCGARGVACFACSTNQFCSNGQCTGANTGDTGATCAFNADCKEAILGGATRECVPPYRADGGASGWPGGYCSNTGCDSFVDCPGTTGSCGRDGNCYATCLIANLGQSNCRPGYVCSDALTVDGGTFALCVPDCRNPGYAGCGAGRSCNPLGYCN